MAEKRADAQITAYDQSLARANAEVDLLIKALRTMTDESGERRGLADFCGLIADRGADELAGLFAAAAWRLANSANIGTSERPRS